jgi:hypothetical protein
MNALLWPSAAPLVVLALAPIPDVSFVLQTMALGAAVGSIVALRAKRRYGSRVDASAITTAWATLGLVIGLTMLLAVCIK